MLATDPCAAGSDASPTLRPVALLLKTGAQATWEGGCTHFVHGRSRMTIYPRILTMPGRNTSGFHQPGRHCLHQARSAVRCSASRMKSELHPSKNPARKPDFGTLCLLSCLWMIAPMRYFVSGVVTPERAMGITM